MAIENKPVISTREEVCCGHCIYSSYKTTETMNCWNIEGWVDPEPTSVCSAGEWFYARGEILLRMTAAEISANIKREECGHLYKLSEYFEKPGDNPERDSMEIENEPYDYEQLYNDLRATESHLLNEIERVRVTLSDRISTLENTAKKRGRYGSNNT